MLQRIYNNLYCPWAAELKVLSDMVYCRWSFLPQTKRVMGTYKSITCHCYYGDTVDNFYTRFGTLAPDLYVTAQFL